MDVAVVPVLERILDRPERHPCQARLRRHGDRPSLAREAIQLIARLPLWQSLDLLR
jgi:hypothetical protein